VVRNLGNIYRIKIEFKLKIKPSLVKTILITMPNLKISAAK